MRVLLSVLLVAGTALPLGCPGSAQDDAGVPGDDAGAAQDAGPVDDAGTATPDAGPIDDAGPPPQDAGRVDDAGTAQDAGPIDDAGTTAQDGGVGIVDGGGRAGGVVILPDGGGPVDGGVGVGECSTPPTAVGELASTLVSVDYSGRPVTATLEHRRDIDDGGCLSHVDVTVGTIDGGCELSLTFAPNASRDGFVLLSARWNLDNFCPGLGDQDQALYILSDAGEAGMTGFNVTADPTATDACVRQTVAPYGEIVLQSGSSFLTVDLGALSFVGDFSSTGVDGATCACPYGFSGADCTACGARFEEPNCNVCREGFYGEGCAYSCEEGFAPPQCVNCLVGFQDNDNNGTCVPDCTTAALDCSGHGACADDSGATICECEANYEGVDCGACVAGYQDGDGNGTCEPDCDTAQLTGCSGSGVCDDVTGSAVCTCELGYDGLDCSVCAVGFQDTDGNGSCLPNCDTAGLTGCSGNGQCSTATGAATCTCDAFWIRDDCSAAAFFDIAASWSSTCGLRQDGRLDCVGNGPAAAPPVGLFNSIGAGEASGCATNLDDNVQCWGDAPPDPVANYLIADVSGQVSLGYGLACGIQPDGQISCWRGAAPPADALGYDAVATSTQLSCGKTIDGYVNCSGGSGALGALALYGNGEVTEFAVDRSGAWGCSLQGTTIDCLGHVNEGVSPPPGGAFSTLDVGTNFACAARSAGGVTCWGNDPTNRIVTAAPASGNYVNVTVGAWHACGILTSGEVHCWGDDSNGEAPSLWD